LNDRGCLDCEIVNSNANGLIGWDQPYWKSLVQHHRIGKQMNLVGTSTNMPSSILNTYKIQSCHMLWAAAFSSARFRFILAKALFLQMGRRTDEKLGNTCLRILKPSQTP
jgi:hypothetical protein